MRRAWRSVCAKLFKASFKNKEILDAMLQSARGNGQSAALRQWELETINALGWRESDWVLLSLSERYHKVCAHKLGDWMMALESEEEMKRIRA